MIGGACKIPEYPSYKNCRGVRSKEIPKSILKEGLLGLILSRERPSGLAYGFGHMILWPMVLYVGFVHVKKLILGWLRLHFRVARR